MRWQLKILVNELLKSLFIWQEVLYIICVFIIVDYVKKYTTSNAFKNEIPYHWNNKGIPLEIAVESLDHNV